jgi:hypothetical protein
MKNKPLTSPSPVPPATRAEVERFLKGLQEYRAKGIDKTGPPDEAEVRKYDEAGVKAYLDKMTVGSQQGIARRIMMDILKSPTADFPGRGGERKKGPTKKKKASPKAKSKRASKSSKAKKKKAGKRR